MDSRAAQWVVTQKTESPGRTATDWPKGHQSIENEGQGHTRSKGMVAAPAFHRPQRRAYPPGTNDSSLPITGWLLSENSSITDISWHVAAG